MVKEVFQKSVLAQLAKNNNTKWGAEESVAVIIDLLVDNTGAEELREDAELVQAIKKVVNPSQFAQSLESTDNPANPKEKLLKRAGRGAKTKDALLMFGK